MKKNKILICPKNTLEIEKYKKIGITNFLFAVDNFSIGYNTYSLEELKKLNVNIYLNINIIFDSKKINEFKDIIDDLSFVKGIFFEDLGIYQILKTKNIPLIWNQSHFVINKRSINFWLDRVHSALLSNELTKEEIIYILDNSIKSIVLEVYGNNIAMYSRRLLLTSFNLFKGNKEFKEGDVIVTKDNHFIVHECDNGTVFFYSKPFNYSNILKDLPDDKIELYYYDNSKISFEEYLELDTLDSAESFLNNKTIYRLGDK